MIQYLLAALGGYLIWDAKKSSFSEGGLTSMEVNTEVIAVKGNIMGTTSLELKIKGMKKPQDFIVYPISAERAGKPIMIQSDTRFGYLDLNSGMGLMSQSHPNGAYSYHFSVDKKVPFKISESDLKKIKEHISSTAGSKVGKSIVFSDNSGASMMNKGGVMKSSDRRLVVLDIAKTMRSYYEFLKTDDGWERNEEFDDLENGNFDKINIYDKLIIEQDKEYITFNGKKLYNKDLFKSGDQYYFANYDRTLTFMPNGDEGALWVDMNRQFAVIATGGLNAAYFIYMFGSKKAWEKD